MATKMKVTDFANEQDFKNHKKNLKRVEVALDRKHRVNIVNEIIKEIANCGRRFFHNEGLVAELSAEYGKIYYNAEYGPIKKICLNIPDYRKPKGWFHGGTLLHLVKEFRDFIKNGEKREYSVLFSSHWGYPEKDMVAIRKKAFELGFLRFSTEK
jgi:hypothetical protein